MKSRFWLTDSVRPLLMMMMMMLSINLNHQQSIHTAAAEVSPDTSAADGIDPQRLAAHKQFLELRSKCKWVQATEPLRCAGYRMDCEIGDVELEEGRGLFRISRFGPFVTRGGTQNVLCDEKIPMPPVGSWLKSYTIQVIDPFTEEPMSFPPLHLHHSVPFTDVYAPRLGSQVRMMLPMIATATDHARYFITPVAASDTQCLPRNGGSACNTLSFPTGYGKRFTGSMRFPEHLMTVHTQDVRIAGSPPLAHSVELATVHFIPVDHQDENVSATSFIKGKSHKATAFEAADFKFVAADGTAQYMRPIHDMAIAMFGSAEDRTYHVELNTSMFVHNTVYFPVRAEVMNVRVHWHPVDGDEFWIVRGRQEDMNLPKQFHKPAVYTTKQMFRGKAMMVPLSSNVDDGSNVTAGIADSIAFKTQIELAIAEAEQRWRSSKSNENSMKSSRSDTIFQRHDVKWEQQPGQLKNYRLPRAPKLLCKFYGQTDQVTRSDLNNRAAAVKELYLNRNSSTLRSNFPNITENFNQSEDRSLIFHEMISYRMKRVNYYEGIDTVTTVTPEEQQRNMFEGTLPGNYYRAGSHIRSEQCDHFDVEPGEFLTIIHFLEPRSRPNNPKEVYDPTNTTTNQHTVLMGMIRFADANKRVSS